jgi:hypothetical protein
MKTYEFNGHKLVDNGNVPEYYFDITGHDVINDTVAQISSEPKPAIFYGSLYVALRLAYQNVVKEEGKIDPDINGKSVSDIRKELPLSEMLKPDLINICNKFITRDTDEKKPLAGEATGLPANSSTQSSSPSSSGSPNAGSGDSVSAK